MPVNGKISRTENIIEPQNGESTYKQDSNVLSMRYKKNKRKEERISLCNRIILMGSRQLNGWSVAKGMDKEGQAKQSGFPWWICESSWKDEGNWVEGLPPVRGKPSFTLKTLN